MRASTRSRLFSIRPIILGLFLALVASVLLVGCGNSSGGTINTVAGNTAAGYSGDGGVAIDAELRDSAGVAVDTSGNFYIADSGNNFIRKVTISTGIITTVAGNGQVGTTVESGSATSVALNYPIGIAVDSSGDIFFADQGNNVIREVTPPSGTATVGNIMTVAGNGTPGYGGDNGPATGAMLNVPTSVAVDSSGNLYIADLGNNVIRKVAGGVITTVAGTAGVAGFDGDGGAATSALLNGPRGVAVDPSGNHIYIADSGNNVIREVSSGDITTIAGTEANPPGDYGDNGPATSALLFDPTGVAVDSSGNIYIADLGNNVVRKVTPPSAPATSGIITTAAGNAVKGDTGNGGPATRATLNGPTNVAVDSSGKLYIADSGNNVIREVTY